MALTSYQGLFVMKKGRIFVDGYTAEFMNPANKPSAPVEPEVGPTDSEPENQEPEVQEAVVPKAKTRKTKEA